MNQLILLKLKLKQRPGTLDQRQTLHNFSLKIASKYRPKMQKMIALNFDKEKLVNSHFEFKQSNA